MRPLRILHFSMMTFFGIVSVRLSGATGSLAIDIFDTRYWPYIAGAMFLTIFAWQFTTMINDVHDVEIDRISHKDRALARGLISTRRYINFAIMCAVLSLALGLFLGWAPFLLAAFFVFLGIIYSTPPVRLRNSPFGTVIVGAGSLAAFLIGVYSPSTGLFEHDIQGIAWPRMPGIANETGIMGLLIFLLLSIAPLINAYKDHEGDKKAGARTIYTILGKERGKRIVTALVPVLFLAPALLLNSRSDIMLFGILGAAGTFAFWKFENSNVIFGLYFVELSYGLLRLLDILN